MNYKRVENEELRQELEHYVKDLPANRPQFENLMLPRTQRQKEILDYIYRFMAKHGHEPSYAQIARYFDVSSKATIAKHISALEKRGLIKREHEPGRFTLAVKVKAAPPDTLCEATAPRPPFNAEYILYLLLARDERDFVIGDLIEGYGEISTRFNKRRADLWFYKQVAGSLWPLLRRALLEIQALAWLGRILRRLVS